MVPRCSIHLNKSTFSYLTSGGSNALSGGARDQVMLMPFIALGNPVIAQAAFLTAVVSPRVSAAAACAVGSRTRFSKMIPFVTVI